MTSKFALVIANTEYQDANFAKLTAPGKDAEEFAQVLRELATFDEVQVLLNEGEGKTRRSIARFFSERKRDDLLLLYFSGHGVRNDVGQLFLAAHDTEINILEASGIPADFVTQSMNNSRSQRQLLILDCCNSGAFAYGSKSASAVGKSMGIATAFEGSGFGRVVLTATDATQYAWEGDKVIGDTQKSVFTHFLIEGLKGEADRNSDGRIHVDELYDYAYEQVVRRTPKQTPGKWSYKQQGDIVLRENLKPREVKPASLPSDLLELLSHPNSSVRKVGIQDLISLLNGKHLGLARGAEEKLREIAENDDSFSFRRTASEALTARGLIVEPPAPVPFDIPKEKQAEKPALATEERVEGRIEKPSTPPRESPSPFGRGQGDALSMSKREGVSPRYAPEKKKIISNSKLRQFVGVSAGLFLTTFCIWGGVNYLSNILFDRLVTITPTGPFSTSTIPPQILGIIDALATDTAVAQVTNVSPFGVPLVTQSAVPSATVTPNLGIGSTMIGNDNMTLLYVPAGEFTMGSDTGASDEKPIHTVTLDAFWIDQTEVTNAMYAKCMDAGMCKLPSDTTRYDDPNYANHPVVYVSWDQAMEYCTWADRRLPTEAEWEKAARWKPSPSGGGQGEGESLIYPWGNDAPNNTLLNYNSAIGDTTEVGSYPNGASPYGALDMAGNVWEWISSLYQPYPYDANDDRENLTSLDARLLRGGAWGNGSGGVRSALRSGFNPTLTDNYLGFRCASSP